LQEFFRLGKKKRKEAPRKIKTFCDLFIKVYLNMPEMHYVAIIWQQITVTDMIDYR